MERDDIVYVLEEVVVLFDQRIPYVSGRSRRRWTLWNLMYK